MSATPDGISDPDWQATPTPVRAFILDQQAELQAQQPSTASSSVASSPLKAWNVPLQLVLRLLSIVLIQRYCGRSWGRFPPAALVLGWSWPLSRLGSRRADQRALTSGGMMSLGPVSDRIRAETGYGREPCVNRVTGLVQGEGSDDRDLIL